jgi:hypothetical protein
MAQKLYLVGTYLGTYHLCPTPQLPAVKWIPAASCGKPDATRARAA